MQEIFDFYYKYCILTVSIDLTELQGAYGYVCIRITAKEEQRMATPFITFFVDEKSKQPNNLPNDINTELIEFIGKKIMAAGYMNLKAVSNAFGTKNPSKILLALRGFSKTGRLNEHYMRQLSKLVSFEMNEVEEITARHYAELDTEACLCAEHFDLILQNTDRIIATKEFRNITFYGLGIKASFIERHRPLTLGELMFIWNKNQLIAYDECCGPVYIFAASGSPLSGSHNYRGICSCYKKFVYGSMDTFGEILHPIFKSEFPYEYEPTDCTIAKLVDRLRE